MKAMCPPSYYRNGFVAIIYIILTLFTSCAQSTINWKNDNDVIFCWHDAIIECFWRWRVSLVKLSYWLNFNVSIIAGSWIMKLVYKRLTINPEIGSTPPSEFCPISGDRGKLGVPNLAGMSLMKSYLMLQNASSAAFTFTVSELVRENR